MNLQLTPQQQQVLDQQENDPPRIEDPRTKTTYVLVQESDYKTLQALLEEERQQEAIHSLALKNAAGRIDDKP